MEINGSNLKKYRDRLLGAVVAVCLVAAIGHLIQWTEVHKSTEWQISLGFFAIWAVLILCSPNRIKALYYCFIAMTAFGVLGAIAGRTLAGLPILLPSAIVTGAILVWKGDQLKQ
jgi:uncharacterized membrane protein YoaK (UPF0700 family)